MSSSDATMTDNELTPDNPLFWSQPSPVNCDTIRILGIFLCLAALAGVTCNGTLLYSFARYKTLRSPSNIFFMFIAGLGLFASFTILPLTGTSSIYCRWLYNRGGCKFSAIIAFLYGCASSYLLCGASLTRCYIIIQPFKAKSVTVGRCIVLSCVAVFLALIWTLLPLMGWNEYIMEGARTSCCINWYDRSRAFMSYTYCLFAFVYCLPLGILSITNGITLMGIRRMREKIELGIHTPLTRKRVEMERRIVKSILFTTVGFICTWTPYTITLFLSVFRDKTNPLPPLGTFLCACFAKTSVIWIPSIYIGTSTHFNLRFVNTAVLEQQQVSGSNRIDAAPRDGQTTLHQRGLTAIPAVSHKELTAPNEQ